MSYAPTAYISSPSIATSQGPMSFRTDRVCVVVAFKGREDLTGDQVRALVLQVVEDLKALPLVQKNILKFEVSLRVDDAHTKLANALGLPETEFCGLSVWEADSHEKIIEVVEDPAYAKILESILQGVTGTENFHVFPAEFITIIDK
ncbi:hypothetical protein C8R44DRAFT_866109 [Mycena epipterygia]|nr:hypothetical protein C8R44DRAFT_866109 [Mycena epipterygia]